MASSWTLAMLALQSKLQSLGLFSSVPTAEPKTAPGTGVMAAVYLNDITPIAMRSGLSTTSGLVEFTLRLYSNAIRNDITEVDPELMDKIDVVWQALIGDYTLGGVIEEIDIFGAYGNGLSVRAGHVDVGGALFRAYDIKVPCVMDDVYPEVS